MEQNPEKVVSCNPRRRGCQEKKGVITFKISSSIAKKHSVNLSVNNLWITLEKLILWRSFVLIYRERLMVEKKGRYKIRSKVLRGGQEGINLKYQQRAFLLNEEESRAELILKFLAGSKSGEAS